MDLPPTSLVSLLYAGWFSRAPDQDGLKYWRGEIEGADSPEASAREISEGFRASAEAQARYPGLGAGSSDADPDEIDAFVVSAYQALFDRAPEDAGLDFWHETIRARLDAGEAIGGVMVDMIEGAGPADLARLEKKAAAGVAYAEAAGPGYRVDASENAEVLAVAGRVDSPGQAEGLGAALGARAAGRTPPEMQIDPGEPLIGALVDADWYRANVIESVSPGYAGDAVRHFVEIGAPAGFAPSPAMQAFDAEAYLNSSLLARALVEAGWAGSAMDAWLRAGRTRGDTPLDDQGREIDAFGVFAEDDRMQANPGDVLDLLANDALGDFQVAAVRAPEIEATPGILLESDGNVVITDPGVAGSYPVSVILSEGPELASTLEVTPATPTASITAGAAAREGSGEPLVFEVALDGPAAGAITLELAAVGGTADPVADLADAPMRQVTLSAGQTRQEAAFEIADDDLSEGDETLSMLIRTVNPDDPVEIGADRLATATIQDDDMQQTVQALQAPSVEDAFIA